MLIDAKKKSKIMTKTFFLSYGSLLSFSSVCFGGISSFFFPLVL